MAEVFVRPSAEKLLSRSFELQRKLSELNTVCSRARIEKMLPADEYGWLARHVERFKKALIVYERSCSLQDTSRQRSSCLRLLQSFSSRVSSVAKVIILDGRYEGLSRYALDQRLLTTLAERIDLCVPLMGHAHVITKPKTSGATRETLCFSGNVRSASYLVECVLAGQGLADEYNFALNGLGQKGAIQHIEAAMIDGHRFWLSFDFAHNFPSVKRLHLDWLQLPNQVICNVLFPNEYLSISNRGKYVNMKSAVRQGLPQGAAVSGQIASALIRRKLEKITSGEYRRVSYGDDVVIGARSLNRVNEVAKAIKGSFEKDPAGPLTFSKFEISNTTEGIEFIGNHLSLTNWDDAIQFNRRPNNKAWKRFRDKLNLRMHNQMSFDERTDFARGYAIKWAKSFGDWWEQPRAYEYLMVIAETDAAHFSPSFATNP